MKKDGSWAHLMKICQDDKDCLEKFRAVMLEELPTETEGLHMATKAQDLLAAAELVHKIKHKFALVEMKAAYQYALTYEVALKEGDSSGADTFVAYLELLHEFLGEY